MLPSAYNVRAPLASGDVFLMNTLTDAQLVVSPDVAALLDDGATPGAADADTRAALETLAGQGFLVTERDAEQRAVESHFKALRADASELSVTLLTTMACNFACEYCYQGDHGPSATPAERMSIATAGRVADWIAKEIERVRPGRLSLTFFGGEPLLNTPAMFEIAERSHAAATAAGIPQGISIVTNGMLLTPAIVNRLLPLGLYGVKVTLDGDRETHDRKRPMRGGQPTFDRIIDNMRRVAPLVPLTVGGNFDQATVERYPALLDFLREQDFAGQIVHVSFKPVIAPPPAPGGASVIPLSLVRSGSPATGAGCHGGSGTGGASVCDSCHFADEHMAFLQGETRRRGFATIDGVHMGPCELYRQHAHTIGPDGTLYACPGFTGENARPVGHIDGGFDPIRSSTAARFDALEPWRRCGDCAFIPVCGGGCAVAAHTELGDLSSPSCHKRVFELSVAAFAEESARTVSGG